MKRRRAARCPFPDTSTQYVRTPTRRTPRERFPTRVFFTFHTLTGRVRAPKGYGFDGRGDLINVTKRGGTVREGL